jgi:hypothetical protein
MQSSIANPPITHHQHPPSRPLFSTPQSWQRQKSTTSLPSHHSTPNMANIVRPSPTRQDSTPDYDQDVDGTSRTERLTNPEVDKILRNSLYLTFNAPQVDEYVCVPSVRFYLLHGFSFPCSPIRRPFQPHISHHSPSHPLTCALPNLSPSIEAFSLPTLQSSLYRTQAYPVRSSTHPTPKSQSGSSTSAKSKMSRHLTPSSCSIESLPSSKMKSTKCVNKYTRFLILFH